MENTLILAQIFGPYLIIVAIGIMFNLKTYQRVMEDFFKNSALIYLGGVMALIFGLVIVLLHNVWMAHWAVIITIFGWLGLIKGAWLIIFPNTVAKFTEAYKKKTALLVVHLLIILILGVVLTIRGYFTG